MRTCSSRRSRRPSAKLRASAADAVATSSDLVNLDAAAERAVTAWPIDVQALSLVALSENAVFRVDARDGRSYALRIHRAGYNTRQEMESELVWTSALRGAGIAAPRPVRTRDGQAYTAVGVGARGEPRLVGVVEWVAGVSLAALIEQERDGPAIARHFSELGRLAARIHNQASGWAAPPGFVRRSWDADGLVGEQPLWGRFWELPELRPAQRDVLSRARAAIWGRLQDYGQEPATYGLIHADLHSSNVLVDREQVSVIDFDDAGFGWHQYELAVALSAQLGAPSPEAMRAALIRGYRSVRPLSEDALALLPLFSLIRSVVLLGWIDGRPELDHGDRLGPLIEAACSDADAFCAGRLI